jgi:hypothetical protein
MPMAYSVEKIIEKEWGNDWYPQKRGRWEVRDENGNVVHSFKWKMKADLGEWPEREWWTGPMDVRISEDGKFVECLHQAGIAHGASFPDTQGQRVERHPLHITEES